MNFTGRIIKDKIEGQMKLVVGLGNPGKEYQNTRHNAGFEFVDQFSEHGVFSQSKKFESEILEKDGLLLVKPSTYMNDSGRAVKKIMDFYKMNPAQVVIVHDDLDIELGEKKIQLGVGPKVHNGVSSVEQYLGTKNFMRIRLGVDGRKQQPTALTGADYVLGRFGKEEKEVLKKTIDEAITELLITLSL